MLYTDGIQRKRKRKFRNNEHIIRKYREEEEEEEERRRRLIYKPYERQAERVLQNYYNGNTNQFNYNGLKVNMENTNNNQWLTTTHRTPSPPIHYEARMRNTWNYPIEGQRINKKHDINKTEEINMIDDEEQQQQQQQQQHYQIITTTTTTTTTTRKQYKVIAIPAFYFRYVKDHIRKWNLKNIICKLQIIETQTECGNLIIFGTQDSMEQALVKLKNDIGEYHEQFIFELDTIPEPQKSMLMSQLSIEAYENFINQCTMYAYENTEQREEEGTTAILMEDLSRIKRICHRG